MPKKNSYPGIEKRTLANGTVAFYGFIKKPDGKWTRKRLKARTASEAAR